MAGRKSPPMTDPCPRRQFVEAPIAGAMGEPFVGKHAQHGELTRGEACRDRRRQRPCCRVLTSPQKRSPPVRRALFRGPLNEVPRRYGRCGCQQATGDRLSPSPPLDHLGELLCLIVGNDAHSMSLPDLAGEIVELGSSGTLDRCRECVIGMRSHSRTPCWGRVLEGGCPEM
jgi:hypothetical protein